MELIIKVAPLESSDYIAWVEMARGYKAFYNTPISDEEISNTWTRIMQGTDIFGIGAKLNGKLVGIAHYLFDSTVWAPSSCYLQDLFTAPEVRGRGIARNLIEFVAQRAKDRGAERFYWTTQEENSTARSLYDKIAKFNGFIRYDFPIKE